MKSKTIFVSIPQGFSARYLLRSGILQQLNANGFNIVALLPETAKAKSKETFGDIDVIYEHLDLERSHYAASTLEEIMRKLRSLTIPHRLMSETDRSRQEHFLNTVGRKVLMGPFYKGVFNLALASLARYGWLRRSLVQIESRCFTNESCSDLVARYRPVALITTNPGYVIWPADAFLIREAKKHGSLSICTVIGWDNPSSRGLRGACPDYYVVWSERLKRDMIDFQDVSEDKVIVAGNPLFDVYAYIKPVAKNNSIKHIVFGTGTPFQTWSTLKIARLIAESISNGKLGVRSKLIIRVHPIMVADSKELSGLKQLAAEHPHVELSIPNVFSPAMKADIPWEETEEVAILMRRADVLVNVFSTLQLEAAICDVPIINLQFEVGSAPPGHGPRRSYVSYPHLRPVIATGGTRIAWSEQQLIDHLKTYLENPELDSQGRRLMAGEFCGPVDGSNRKRCAQTLYDLVSSS